jgi:hypothetical protein
MDRVAKIIASAHELTSEERQRLLRELSVIDRAADAVVPENDEASTIQALLDLAGSAISEHTDLSADKYKHVATSADAKR